MDGWMVKKQMNGWMEWGGMADGHQSCTRPGLLPSFNPMPHHKKINKEMTQETAPIQTSTAWEPQAGFPLISRRNYLHPTHLRAEFSSPSGHWHFPAPGSFLVGGVGNVEGIQEKATAHRGGAVSPPCSEHSHWRLTGGLFISKYSLWGAQGWCTGMTLREGMGREVRGGLKMGNTCRSMADSCQCMAKTTNIL